MKTDMYPAGITFVDLCRRNQRNSTWLLAGCGLVLFGGLFTILNVNKLLSGQGLWHSEKVLATVTGAVGITILIILWSLTCGAGTVLFVNRARRVSHADDAQLFNVVEEIALAAGLPVPRIYLVDTSALNSFAAGLNPKRAVLAITRGLRERLNREELAGVLAHEMAHIRHRDVRLMTILATAAGIVPLLHGMFMRVAAGTVRALPGLLALAALTLCGFFKSKAHPLIKVLAVFLLFWLVCELLTLLLAMVIIGVVLWVGQVLFLVARFALMRQREFLADVGAVELRRDARGILGALEKMRSESETTAYANRATQHLWFVTPVAFRARRSRFRAWCFDTHPRIEERIARLQALIREPTPGGAF